MPDVISIPHRLGRRALVHSARTAVAAVLSLVVARAFGLSEAYWATVMTLIIMQSTLGAAWTVSEQRLAGTAMGAANGVFLTAYFGSNVIVFAAWAYSPWDWSAAHCILRTHTGLPTLPWRSLCLSRAPSRRGLSRLTASSKSPWESPWGWR